MGLFRLASFSAPACLVACGLSVVGQAPPGGGASDGGTVEDTGAPPTTPGEDGAPPANDGGDGGDGALGCTTVIDDDFTTLSSSWDRFGDAAHRNSNIELTDGTSSDEVGALFWNTPIRWTGSLRVEVDLSMTQVSGGIYKAITAVWLENGTRGVGGTDSGMGLCGVGMLGTAIALDAYNGSSSNQRMWILSSMDGNCGNDGEAITSGNVANAQHLTMMIRPTSITGTTDAGLSATRTRTNAQTGYLGFTAASGGAYRTQHTIARVVAVACP